MIRALFWYYLTRLGMWAIRQQIRSEGFVIQYDSIGQPIAAPPGASADNPPPTPVLHRIYDLTSRYREMSTELADTSDALHRVRAGVR